MMKVGAVVFMLLSFFLSDKPADDIIKIAAAMTAIFLPIDASQFTKALKGNAPKEE
jgi:hypothetical protein